MAVKKPAKKTVKKRNADHRDSDHPIEVTKHWRQGPPGYLSQWQRAHHAGQTDLFAHGIKAAQIRKKNAAKRKKNSDQGFDQAVKNRKEFAGQFGGIDSVFAPTGTPKGLSKLGEFAELTLKDKSTLFVKKQGVIQLAQDNNHKIHFVSTQPGPMVDIEPGNYGPVKVLEYVETKPHLGENEPIQWVHKMGEITGELPELIVDKNGQLKLKGGAYTINWRGIIN